MKVIGLERGPQLKTADFEAHDELRFFQRQDLRPNPKTPAGDVAAERQARAQIRCRRMKTAIRPAAAPCITARCHGACTKTIFARAPRPIERYGASAIPEDSSLADWPVSYAELEPFYDKAEYELGVSGKAGNIQGKKIGAAMSSKRRAREYPLKPLLVDQSAICSKPAPTSLASTRSRRRARSCRSRTTAVRAAPIAASARRSAATSGPSPRSWSPSCRRPKPPAISS